MAVLRNYVKNQAILEPILLYWASKCKQTKEQGSKDCLWTHILTFLWDYCQLFLFFMSRCKQNKIKLCYNRSFIPRLLNFSDLPNYGSNLKKRYALRLLPKCLVKSTLLSIGGKVHPILRCLLWFPLMGSFCLSFTLMF